MQKSIDKCKREEETYSQGSDKYYKLASTSLDKKRMINRCIIHQNEQSSLLDIIIGVLIGRWQNFSSLLFIGIEISSVNWNLVGR